MAHDIFISYVVDDRKTADAVCAILEKNKIRCWVAPRGVQRDYGRLAALAESAEIRTRA